MAASTPHTTTWLQFIRTAAIRSHPRLNLDSAGVGQLQPNRNPESTAAPFFTDHTYITAHQGDAVGLFCAAGRTFLEVPPRRNPAHLRTIFEALEKVLENPALKRDLIHKGRERSLGFQWDLTAQKHLALFELLTKKK